MHGVKRAKQSREAIEAKKKKEVALLADYRALEEDVIARKRAGDYSEEAFTLTTKLLKLNFEYYSVWNYRRQILERATFPNASPDKINEVLSVELTFTSAALRQHPKVYWIWNHRSWCLEHVPDGPSEEDPHGWKTANWNKELFVVEKMLDADARNFHAWNYRRVVLASLPVPRPPAEELAYTRRKIESNFSNFSAWHQRSKVFASVWETQEPGDVKLAKDAEFELVKNALFIDPNDQSGWLYHRWLVGDGADVSILSREVGVITEILEIAPDSKWCLDSLVHYKRLLLRGTPLGVDSRALRQECTEILQKLEEIDPMRRRRYQDLRREMDVEA
ncbi:rab-protein geranylgeranyltransferase [Exidia glandulosa HHB12029]|uniref:Geranylgeranyl transferase type-2 subunit alpha n=1 Tax=Exidia glandulosa HHB12029 TaxID=1314781 RepID=A0A165DQ64_EXIGL|nr:rab-protein geranylgeranyltransferase [Exidia glandulosa HHB12029]